MEQQTIVLGAHSAPHSNPANSPRWGSGPVLPQVQRSGSVTETFHSVPLRHVRLLTHSGPGFASSFNPPPNGRE